MICSNNIQCGLTLKTLLKIGECCTIAPERSQRLRHVDVLEYRPSINTYTSTGSHVDIQLFTFTEDGMLERHGQDRRTAGVKLDSRVGIIEGRMQI
jgi:hypothetical protein